MSYSCTNDGRSPTVAVVEFQAFKDNDNGFIVKELAIVGSSFSCQLVFCPPYGICHLNEKMRRTARWLTRHYHRIQWEDGEIPYDEEIIRSLCTPFQFIYTKGPEKVAFLKRFHSNVREYPGDGKLCDGIVNCILPQHSGGGARCALHAASKEFVSLQ